MKSAQLYKPQGHHHHHCRAGGAVGTPPGGMPPGGARMPMRVRYDPSDGRCVPIRASYSRTLRSMSCERCECCANHAQASAQCPCNKSCEGNRSAYLLNDVHFELLIPLLHRRLVLPALAVGLANRRRVMREEHVAIIAIELRDYGKGEAEAMLVASMYLWHYPPIQSPVRGWSLELLERAKRLRERRPRRRALRTNTPLCVDSPGRGARTPVCSVRSEPREEANLRCGFSNYSFFISEYNNK